MRNRRIYRCLACLAMALGLTCTMWHGACAAPIANDALYNELAVRGLDGLLDAAFKKGHVPEEKRAAVRDAAMLERLADPRTELTSAQTDVLLQAAPVGIDQILSSKPSVETLSPIAAAFADDVVAPAVKQMQYWGPTADQRASLQPAVTAAARIYAYTEALATNKVIATANLIRSPNDMVHINAWEYALRDEIKDQRKLALMKLWLVMTMTPGDPKRAPLIAEEIATYTGWDTPDSGYQPWAEFNLARLHGLNFNSKDELKLARTGLAQLVAGNPATTPAAPQSLRFEAAIAQVLIDLDASDPVSAAKDLDAAKTFTANNPPAAPGGLLKSLDNRMQFAAAGDETKE